MLRLIGIAILVVIGLSSDPTPAPAPCLGQEQMCTTLTCPPPCVGDPVLDP